MFFLCMSCVVSAGSACAGEIADLKAQVQMLMERVTDLENKLTQSDAAPEAKQPEAVVASQVTVPKPVVKPELKPVVASGNDRVKLALSGHINRAVLFADNGFRSRVFHVDNDNTSTRFQLAGRARISDGWTIGSNMMVQIESNSSVDVDIGTDTDSDVHFTERKIEIFVESPFGKLWLGQGEAASDNTNEIDLSGTAVVAIGASAELLAGGLTFRSKADPDKPGPRIKDVWNPMDGLDRGDRIRYDSPTFYGFSVGGGHMDGDRSDAVIRFAGEFDGTKVQAAAAFTNIPLDRRQYNAAGAVLFPSGISASVAWGMWEPKINSDNHHANMIHTKWGYQQKWIDWGITAFAVDYGEARDIDQGGDKMRTAGIFAVQHLDPIATELFWGLRWHKLDRRNVDFKDIVASMLGARVKF